MPRQPPLAPVVSSQIAVICAELKHGLSLRDACSSAGANLASVRRTLWRGERAKGGDAREAYHQVQAAYAEYRRAAQGAVLKAAAKGVPAALDRLCERLDAMDADLARDPPIDPLEYARWRLADIQRRLATANGIAYNQLLIRETDLKRQISELAAAIRETEREREDLRALTEGEAAERLAARVEQLSDSALRDLARAIHATMESRGLT